jgi:hypothetical protein
MQEKRPKEFGLRSLSPIPTSDWVLFRAAYLNLRLARSGEVSFYVAGLRLEEIGLFFAIPKEITIAR